MKPRHRGEVHMASMTSAWHVWKHQESVKARSHRCNCRRGLNRPNLRYPLAHLKGSARKAGVHLHNLATGGEAEPSPPWHVCLGCAFTQPPPKPLRYGAGLARQTFVPRLCLRQRAGCLRTSPPESGIPCALVLVASSAQAASPTSPKPIDWMGRPDYPAAWRSADACRVLHQSICSAEGHDA